MAATIQHIELPKKPRALDSSTSVQEVSQEILANVGLGSSDTINSSSYSLGWTSSGSEVSIASNRLVLTNGSGSPASTTTYASNGTNSDVVVAGNTYTLTYTVISIDTGSSAVAAIRGYLGSTNSTVLDMSIGTNSVTFTAGASTQVGFNNATDDSILILDDISLKQVETFSNNNHGKIYSGRALEFDGVTDYLETAHSTSLNPGSSGFTIACWAKTNSTYSGTGIILSKGGSGAEGYTLYFSGSTGTLTSDYHDGTTRALADSTVSLLNTWIRLVAVHDNSDGKTRLYANGELIKTSSNAASGSVDPTAALKIGANSSGGEALDGNVSDVQLWNSSWSADDIAYDFANPESLALNASGTALTEGNLKLWYPMQDGHRGQQSYILDGANTGLGDEIADLTTGSSSESSYWSSATTSGVSYADSGQVSYYSLSSSVVSGVSYRVQATVSNYSGSGDLGFSTAGGVSSQARLSANGDISEVFVSDGDSPKLFGRAGNSATFSNISLKPINDKHHATTVFYGDELIGATVDRDFSGSGNWAAYNSSTAAIDSAKLKVTVDGGGTSQGAQLPIARVGDGTTTSVVTGRTYQISAKLDFISGSDTDLVFSYYLGNTSVSVGTITTTETTYTATVTTANNTNNLMIRVGSTENNSGSDNVFTIDDVSIKEVGVASGWTDADQQLDIAQPALQSYNELAWFDGAADFVQLSDPYNHTSISISAWVYPMTSSGSSVIFANRDTATDGLIFYWSANTLTLYSKLNNTSISSGANLTEGKWQHVVFTHDGSSQKFYINGVVVGSASNTEVLSVTTNARLMKDSYANQYYSNGSVTGVSIHSTAINAGKVLEIYNEGKELDITTFSGYSAVEGYFRNNRLSTWTDLSTNSNDGAVTGSETLLIPQGVDGSRDAQGFIMNRARNTSSANMPSDESQIECGPFTDIIAQGASAASMECWMKADGTEGSDVYATFAGERTGKNILLCRNSGTSKAQAVYSTSTSGNNNGLVSTTADVFDNNWHHIAFTFGDGDGVGKLYVDGSHEDTATNAGETLSMDDATFFVGGGDNTATERAFNGTVDGVKVYSDTLSATEVLRNYNATKGSHRN